MVGRNMAQLMAAFAAAINAVIGGHRARPGDSQRLVAALDASLDTHVVGATATVVGTSGRWNSAGLT